MENQTTKEKEKAKEKISYRNWYFRGGASWSFCPMGPYEARTFRAEVISTNNDIQAGMKRRITGYICKVKE